MIGPGAGVRIYLACGPTDMRKGIGGLFTGQDALLDGDGRTFAEITTGRGEAS